MRYCVIFLDFLFFSARLYGQGFDTAIAKSSVIGPSQGSELLAYLIATLISLIVPLIRRA